MRSNGLPLPRSRKCKGRSWWWKIAIRCLARSQRLCCAHRISTRYLEVGAVPHEGHLDYTNGVVNTKPPAGAASRRAPALHKVGYRTEQSPSQEQADGALFDSKDTNHVEPPRLRRIFRAYESDSAVREPEHTCRFTRIRE